MDNKCYYPSLQKWRVELAGGQEKRVKEKKDGLVLGQGTL